MAAVLILPAKLRHELAVSTVRALSVAQTGGASAGVVADARALQEFDSSALAVLLACRRQVLAGGKAFSVLGMPERLRRLAGLYGVEALLPAA